MNQKFKVGDIVVWRWSGGGCHQLSGKEARIIAQGSFYDYVIKFNCGEQLPVHTSELSPKINLSVN